METAAKKKNSLALVVIASMIAWVSTCLLSSAASASSATATPTTIAPTAIHVALKNRAEVFLGVSLKSVELRGANPANATRYYDGLEGVALECLVAPKGLVDDLVRAGVKHNPADIVDIRRLADKRIVFLEKGNPSAGLQHIILRHASDFARKGIPEAQIPNAIFEAITNGKVVGTSGTGRNARSIYEFVFNGQTHRMGIGIADNGFIVTAFPK